MDPGKETLKIIMVATCDFEWFAEHSLTTARLLFSWPRCGHPRGLVVCRCTIIVSYIFCMIDLLPQVEIGMSQKWKEEKA